MTGVALPRSRGETNWFVLLVPLVMTACAIDDRRLRLGLTEAGAGGEPELGQGGAGASGGGGSNGRTDGLVDGCADLDTDGVSDCETNLLKTATFTSDVSGWTALADTELIWADRNALSDLPSGSAKLQANGLRARAMQCIAVGSEQLVIAYGQAFLTPTGVAEQSQALLEVAFFASDDCGGEPHRFFETPPSSSEGAWTTVHAGGLSTSATAAASITLVGVKPEAADELQVYFDNVMVKAAPFER
jgi:hypothetical protein